MRMLLFAVALVAGGSAYWLWLTQSGLGPDSPAAVSQQLRVLVAARDIAAGTVMAEGDLAWSDIPASDLGAGMAVQATDPEAGTRLIGTPAATALAAGDPVLTATAGKAADRLADMVSPDHRAFAIVVSEASAAGGLVQPGDRIDLLQTRNGAGGLSAEVIAGDLLVLAVDQRLTPATATPPARTLTLDLTLQDLPRISAAASAGGLSVALRPAR